MFWPVKLVTDPTSAVAGSAAAPFFNLLLPTGAQARPRTLPGRKVVIVGCGAVGMACAVAILHRGCQEELVLVDVASDRLEGEVMDLCHGLPFLPRTDLRAGTVEEEGRDADLVVITAGVAQQPGQSRRELIDRNAALFRKLVPPIAVHCPRAVLLVVSNPVDVLTHIAGQLSGFPAHRVIGSGTVLDSARFRMAISHRLGIDPHDVHACVIGEHGDSEVPVWSRVVVAGTGLIDGGWEGSRTLADPELHALFHSEVRQAAYEIIQRKGSTSWAIGLATAEIVEAVLRSKEQMLTVSSRTHGHYGLPDVCLSLPTIVSDSGAAALVQMALTEREMGQLCISAEVLRGMLDAAGF
jgi:L-lactate dehydrogenase